MDEKTYIYERLKKISRGEIRLDEPMFKHTSYKIGGPADIYIEPADFEDVLAVASLCRQEGVNRYVIGNGSNLLVSDHGLRGVVIDLLKAFHAFNIDGVEVRSGAAVVLNQLIHETIQCSLQGLELLSGIPGQVGGGLILNAGAFDSEIMDHLVQVRFVTTDGALETWQRSQIEAGYRKTNFPKDSLLVDAVFMLEPGDEKKLTEQQNEIFKRRRQKQPLSLPSAGSVFKRPPGDYAGRLIEETGCKGLRVGDAMVSQKHANFIVNTHMATAQDVIRVIEEVRERVLRQFNVELELEIHLMGFEKE